MERRNTLIIKTSLAEEMKIEAKDLRIDWLNEKKKRCVKRSFQETKNLLSTKCVCCLKKSVLQERVTCKVTTN